ncbi:iron uptake porin [Laspinema olomoucense]|uniref:Iron uptake porin n=1 Tax=Laspinema olomoucense D3b TaxID=2953688 RepID=A0ABT2NAL1_9CYAN|nr:iron uptake porin [Laspinema sp. D3b]MCT7979744.1 iron uptake porin [Laspinema sp. D3b]
MRWETPYPVSLLDVAFYPRDLIHSLFYLTRMKTAIAGVVVFLVTVSSMRAIASPALMLRVEPSQAEDRQRIEPTTESPNALANSRTLKGGAIQTKPAYAGSLRKQVFDTRIWEQLPPSGDFRIPSPDLDTDPMAQTTSVSQLSDVQPTDWAFQALQSLIERYRCIQGYPDGTFRGDRALTRYEFAAGLNACLERMNERVASAGELISRDDLTALEQLQREFAAELATLQGRVENLEVRTAELESQQFSPTAVFGGEAIFALTGGSGGEPPGEGENNLVFSYLARVGVVASFTGKDRLRLELSSGNFSDRGFANPESFNTDMALLSYQGGFSDRLVLDKLEYRFALSDRAVVTLRPVGFSLSSVLTANSGYFDAGRGALSRFAEASPIFKIGSLDAGAGVDWLLSDRVRLQAAYGTRNSSSLTEGGGFVGADQSAAGIQLLLKPTNTAIAGLTYVNAYAKDGRLDTFTGSFLADTGGIMDEPAQINAIGGSLQWRFHPNLTFGTWGAWMFTNSTVSDASATTTTYLFSLGYSDPFGRPGDLLALLVGQPPKLVDGTDLFLGEDPDTSLHFETFYRWRVSDRISITPGIMYITNPEHNANNEDIFIGTIRTTFRF